MIERLLPPRGPVRRRVLQLAAAPFVLSSCFGGIHSGHFKPSQSFAECDLGEYEASRSVSLKPYEVDPHDISKVRKAIETHPQVLLDTAKRLKHITETGGEYSALHNSQDSAHNNQFRIGARDRIDNPGDILCQVTPFGSQDDKDRTVYYDADGRGLLVEVQAGLAKLDRQ